MDRVPCPTCTSSGLGRGLAPFGYAGPQVCPTCKGHAYLYAHTDVHPLALELWEAWKQKQVEAQQTRETDDQRRAREQQEMVEEALRMNNW